MKITKRELKQMINEAVYDKLNESHTELFNEEYLKKLITKFINGESVTFGFSYTPIEQRMADVYMKENGYHKFTHCGSPKYSNTYEIFYSKQSTPMIQSMIQDKETGENGYRPLNIDGYYIKRIY